MASPGSEPTDIIRVLIVDDHAMFTDSLARVFELEDDIELAGVARTSAEAIASAQEYEPDVVILDYRLPDADGAETTRALVESSPEARVLILTGFGDKRVLAAAIEAGCAGFLTKDQAATDLVDAVRSVHAGDIHLPSEVLKNLAPAGAAPSPGIATSALADLLTAREREVLACLAQGLSTADIASSLGLSVHTVRTHVQNIITKLEVHSKLEAVTLAVREGIITVG